MKKLLSIFLFSLSGIIVLVFCLYSLMWYLVAKQTQKQIDALWQNAAISDIKISGDKPRVGGYPFPPAIHFEGTITDGQGNEWTIPALDFLGFFIPAQTIYAELPQGATITGEMIPEKKINITAAALKIFLPEDLPMSLNEQSIKAWQKSEGHISVQWVSVVAPPLSFEGNGTIGLDEKLQISADIPLQIKGLDILIANLAEKKIITGKEALMVQGLAQVLNEKDPKTGEPIMNANLSIQKRGVFIGPMRIATLQEIVWPWERTPQSSPSP
jgi:hypothetical protein